MESIISQYQVPFLRVGSFLERFPEGIYSIIQNTGGLFVPEKIGANEQLQPHFLVRGVLKNSPTGRIKIKKVGSLLFISWKDSEEVTPIERRVREIHQDWFFHKDTIYSGSYRTNMFHLLNPLHLKSVHKLSQNGIVLDQVTGYIPTDNGGILEFDSRIDRKEEQKNIWVVKKLNSMFERVNPNVKMLRQDKFQNKLILHGPCTTELSILFPENKYVSMVFNLGMHTERSTNVFIDYYSNLGMPKPLLKFFFMLVSPIVVSEDQKYLRRLASKGPKFFNEPRKQVEYSHFLGLYRRFSELYPVETS